MTGSKERLGPWSSGLYAWVTVQAALQLLVGVILGAFYSPAPGHAFETVAAMHRPPLSLLQGFHYWDSALLILESLALLCWLIWTGRYRPPFRRLFFGAFFMFVTAEGFQISGNLLPFDRHGVQTAVVESAIAARAPGIGHDLQGFILAGSSVSFDTLARWWIAHLVLSLISIIGFALALASRSRVRSGLKVSLGGLVLTFALVALVPSPFGSQATIADYDAFNADVSWYVWPLHGAMRLFDQIHSGLGWIGALAIPGLLLIGLFALPFLGEKISQKLVRFILSFSGAFLAIAAIGFGGRFSPLTGTRDPVATGSSTGPIKPINAALQAQGAKLFASLGCNGCHGPNGDKGGAGPSLKTVGQQHPDAEFYEKYIHNPTDVDSQSTMPAFPSTTTTQLQALAEFLRAKR